MQHNELLCRGGRRLQQAVSAMHEVKLLHTDLKASNVFVDSSGDWFLGDFGASNLFGKKIRLCTQVTSSFSRQIPSVIGACWAERCKALF
ncbi:hypothetical protein WJX82_000220 [Trebouxia sp. C0006]